MQIELGHYQQQVSKLQQQLSELQHQDSQWQQRVLEVEEKLSLAEASQTQTQAEKAKQDQTVAQLNEQLNMLQAKLTSGQHLQKQKLADLERQLQVKEDAHAIELDQLQKVLESERSAKAEAQSSSADQKRDSGAASKVKSKSAKTPNDDLTLISGIGPVAAKKLRKLGVKSLSQIAAWTKQDVQTFSADLSVGKRIESEAWIKQAKKLSR